MKKILWLSDSPFTNTGYATISRNVCNNLSDEYDIIYEGHNYVGQQLPKGIRLKDGFTFNFEVAGTAREAYCKDVTVPRILKNKTDVHIILLDTFMLYPWFMDMNYAPAKTIFYFPSDGGIFPIGCENVLKHVDLPIAMSKYARDQVKKLHGIDALYIPHAVDHVNYRPVSKPEKEQYKRDFDVRLVSGQLLKGFLIDKFVVGVVARNQGRKMLDRTVKAFALFCKDKPDAVLFFHSDLYDAAAACDLRELVVRYGIENRVCFSDIRFYENFEYKDMNKVYNVMDVFFLTTSGEGFGVPTVEAMACEIPVVATDYTTTYELIVEELLCGIAVPMVDSDFEDPALKQAEAENPVLASNFNTFGVLTGSWNVERGLMSIPKAVMALNALYRDASMREQFGKNGRVKVLKYYTWDVVMPLWREALRRLLS